MPRNTFKGEEPEEEVTHWHGNRSVLGSVGPCCDTEDLENLQVNEDSTFDGNIVDDDFRWGPDGVDGEIRAAIERDAEWSITARHQKEALERDQGR